jgi:hypothetical protein
VPLAELSCKLSRRQGEHIKRRGVLKLLSMSAAIAALGLGSSSLTAQDKTVKIGILHSLSGTMAISETVFSNNSPRRDISAIVRRCARAM